jgi:hypothetical protein
MLPDWLKPAPLPERADLERQLRALIRNLRQFAAESAAASRQHESTLPRLNGWQRGRADAYFMASDWIEELITGPAGPAGIIARSPESGQRCPALGPRAR